MTMSSTGWQPERPCPIPGHPQDAEDDGPRLVTESAWQRLRAWHLHAPAERLPLPAVVVTWPAAWIMRWLQVPVRAVAWTAGAVTVVTWLAWAWRHWRASKACQADPDGQEHQLRDLFLPTEAAVVAAVWGGWVTAAVAVGPTARPDRWPTLVYLAGAASGYWWLRRHEAVRVARRRRDEAAAELADRRLWHQILPRVGLGDWHVQWRRDTHLGEERLITTSPENALATRIAANASGIAEKLEHILGLPYHRVDVTTTEYPGELIIGIRTVDLAVREAAYHPMTTPWPDAEPSPFVGWFGETASIRDPVIWGFCPEDGSALTLQLYSAIGGRVVGAIGTTGSGKSNLLNNVREFITRCTDARMVQLNGAHMGDETVWEPLSALTLCGPVRTDEEIRNKIAAALAALCLLVTNRSATLAESGHSTFQPTPENPAVEIIIDEVDEIVACVPGAGKALDFLASKQRKSAVGLLLATQRGVVSALGGGMVRANMAEVLVGLVVRATESGHVSGAEKQIPDIREYSRGAPGYFQRWNPLTGEVNGRGRAFLLGKPPEELAYMKRLVEARRHLRDWSIQDLPPLAVDDETPADAVTDATAQEIAGMRGRLASIQSGAPTQAPAVPVSPVAPTRYPAVPGVPPDAVARLVPMLASGRVSAASAGLALGVSKTVAHEYLSAMRKHGLAKLDRRGRASAWRLAHGPDKPGASSPGDDSAGHGATAARLSPIEAFAELVRDGLVEAGEDTRAILMQALQSEDRDHRQAPLHLAGEQRDEKPGPRPYVTVHALAEAVHNGLIDDVDDAAREVLEQAWGIAHGDGQ
jgi:hypothetical protein